MLVHNKQYNVSIKTHRNLWQVIELIIELGKRNLKTKYGATRLGIVWYLLQPFFIASVFVFVRDYFTSHHVVYSLSLIDMFLIVVIWLFFVMAVQSSVSSIGSEKVLISQFRFPVVLIPISIVLVSFFGTLVNIMIYFLLGLIFNNTIIPRILVLMPALVVYLIFVLSVCIMFSMLQKFVRDLKYIIPFVARISFFVLPIFYDVNFVPEKFKTAYEHIPLVWIINCTKGVAKGDFSVLLEGIGLALFISLIFFLISILVFKKLEKFAFGYV